MNLNELINPIVDLSVDAGKAILEVYATDFDVQEKGDKSPLTQADLASHHCIEFTVNIALIDSNRPIFGVVHVPVQNKTYIGCEGHGSELRESGSTTPIRVAEASSDPVRIVGSRSHRGASLDAFLGKVGESDMLPMGSSLKFCVVAEGRADIYPRLGLTSEWDTAAAQAVVEQAGGKVLELDGKPLSYNAKEDILNPWFIVIGAADRDWLALLASDE
jgi:3'(2'), 5'-bisphosphate nucleotidase